VRRLETQLGIRLLNRTTRSVTPTDAGQRLLDRLVPALGEVSASLDALNSFRESPTGTLRLNVPTIVARLVLPGLVPRFLAAHPGITVEVLAEDSFVDVFAAGHDAGVRYDERLERDMVAVPLGPRRQRFLTAASPAYLDRGGRPRHPRDLLGHACIRHRFPSGMTHPWEFEREGEVVRITPAGPLLSSAIELEVSAAVAGLGVVHGFAEYLEDRIAVGELEEVLADWVQGFSGPFLYYPSRRRMSAPLRAFVDFLKREGRG
jgi:DNA-binding transcriptional LysR family regulator